MKRLSRSTSRKTTKQNNFTAPRGAKTKTMNHFNEPVRYRRQFYIGSLNHFLVERFDGSFGLDPMPEKTGYGPFNMGAYAPELFKELLVAGSERLNNDPARDRLAAWFRLDGGEKPVEVEYKDFPPAPHFTSQDWVNLPKRKFPY